MSERTPALLLLLLVLLVVWSRLTAEAVVCRVSAECSLPCPFDPGSDVLIHWLKPPEDPSYPVHSFYNSHDQLSRQKERFRGRTKLDPQQLPHGDATLHISGIVPDDAGKYKCYASTTRGSGEQIVSVDVQAPVSHVAMETDGSTLRCVSNSIVPKPSVSWTEQNQTEQDQAEQNHTEVYSEEGGVWGVVSSVPLPLSSSYKLSCNVSTAHSWRSATYRRRDPVWSRPGTGPQTLFCLDSLSPHHTLLWTFNQSQTILNWTGADPDFGGDWSSRVQLGPGSNLVLKGPNWEKGLYSCIVTTDRETHVVSTEVFLGEPQSAGNTGTVAVAVVVTVLVVLLAVVVGVLLWKHKKSQGVL
ncbi:unnamed protein product [Knipowitschia caucasica]|uniref:Ig-like domain-containing protein n=1 Tax=Knipowitschia caucasica TaxID=637954 RepID=A0AAV2L1Y7_KNICA